MTKRTPRAAILSPLWPIEPVPRRISAFAAASMLCLHCGSVDPDPLTTSGERAEPASLDDRTPAPSGTTTVAAPTPAGPPESSAVPTSTTPAPTAGPTAAEPDAGIAEADASADAPSPCLENDDCAAPAPFCNQVTRACVECLATEHCAQNGLCDLSGGICLYECEGDSDCPPDTPVCNVAERLCVACLDDSHCLDPARPVCDRETRQCVGCTADTHCTCPLLGQAPCCAPSKTCACSLFLCL